MKTIRKWSPFGELATLHEEMDEFFRRAFGTMGGLTQSLWGEAWYPNVECFAKEGNLVVRAEIPGMDPKDVDISIVGNTLTIKGEKKAAKEVSKENYLLSEVRYGSFERTITLPEGVKADNMRAYYKNGILEIMMPAGKAELPRKVAIEVEGAREEKVTKAA
ncbi:MAG: Hsp20/alpha crystallin family protein [Deltaproteobacteria bacterium]|nr:Hsp20/alpha crystallin family protein [Deltaproteobacteria bacterium]